MDPSFLLIHIVNSTFHQPQAGPPFSPERETGCMLFISEAMAFLLSLSVSSSVILSFVPTYQYELTLMVGRNPSWISGSARIYTLKIFVLPFIKL